MQKLDTVIRSMFEDNAAAKINGISRYESIKDYYTENGLDFPVSLTFVTTKNAARLTKDEQISIYAAALKGDTEALENVSKIGNADAKVTFTDTVAFSEAVSLKGYSVTAAKLVDLLSVSDNEKYNKVRKDSRPLFDKSEIPAIIKVLQSMMESK